MKLWCAIGGHWAWTVGSVATRDRLWLCSRPQATVNALLTAHFYFIRDVVLLISCQENYCSLYRLIKIIVHTAEVPIVTYAYNL